VKSITTSSARAYRACNRLFQFKYVLGYKPVKTGEALRRGSLTHLGLNAWWLKPDLDEMLDVVAAQEADEYDLALCQEMLRGYHFRWIDAVPDHEVLDVEQEFDIPIINPDTGYPMRGIRLRGKVDVRCTKKIVEHKTTTLDISAGSNFWRKLSIDTQVSNYMLGTGVDTCLYDVLRTPTLRRLKATPVENRKYKADGTLYKKQREHDETADEYRMRVREAIAEDPDKYYRRGTIVRHEKEITEAQYDLFQQAQLIKESERTGRWPRNPETCFMYSTECAFFDVCSGVESLDNRVRFRKKKSIHEELSK